MRLIDADKFGIYLADLQLSNVADERDSKEIKKEMKTIYEFTGFLMALLEKQPTAYDLDKVVEQLKKLTMDCEVGRIFYGEQIRRKDAIEIVKAGGLDDK